jgi:hypothetical protein
MENLIINKSYSIELLKLYEPVYLVELKIARINILPSDNTIIMSIRGPNNKFNRVNIITYLDVIKEDLEMLKDSRDFISKYLYFFVVWVKTFDVI